MCQNCSLPTKHHFIPETYNVYLPKFDIRYDVFLNNALKSLGLKDAFHIKADFSNLTLDSMYISNVKHASCISIDEFGTEAAAAVAIYFDCSKEYASRDVVIDCPFVYMIKDLITGVILYIGKVIKL
ncbi:proteinase inhibitor I4 serpin-like protein [Leptotrombidium deliense]|uniref:Proteinase inhibitor I4 serpin-like protein n=1 Tax=Leptotrombidium deliense TaxID=299467 RepID=A0A443QKL8_9ACAR|nr:proteinase inhibitor I4 serpin-like protein [Leptotrombidium deliense]